MYVLLRRAPEGLYLNLSMQDILDMDEDRASLFMEWLSEDWERIKSKRSTK